MTLFSRAICALAFTVCVGLAVSRATAQSSNGVLREVYLNITGSTLPDLTNNPAFPNSASLETIQPTFEAPNEFADNYGQRMRALLVPPADGAYVFWIASDDQGALFLSTDEDPAHKVKIAYVNAWTSLREWTKETNQQSAPMQLTNGFRYYIEAIHKEGTGGDNLTVRWKLPSNVIEEPIPNSRLLVYGLGPPRITRQPTNFTTVESSSASFSVALDHMIGAVFQWSRNGTNVPSGTNNVLALPIVTLADSGSTFQCAITNAYGGTNTTNVVLTVLPDTTKPTISTVGNLGEPQVVFVVFSEPVEEASATNIFSYAISGGVGVLRAAFGVDNRTIILTTTPLAANGTYILTVNNVRDRATTPNTILADSQKAFSVTTRPLDASYLSLPREPLGPSTRRQGVVISEVMYHPTNRVDGKNLEFIEVYNSQPWFEEIGGWRISGAIDYTFPSNTVLQARSFLVVAANPADFLSVYTFTNVFGPFANGNGLQNSSGTLRLRNNHDAIIFEMNYSGDPPFPAGADGAGHSVVLARPSYGEADPRAWALSDLTGGNPGVADTPTANTFGTVLINEFLAHTDPPQLDFIELYNYGNTTINLSGCILTDDPETNKFIVPNISIGPRAFVTFDETQLGFSLSSSGETIFLKQPNGRRVLDSVRFGSQENGVSTGRYPDGAQSWTRLNGPSPGTNNAPFKPADVVINEIMYDPISGDSADEFVELFNRGTNAVKLGGWHLRDAISFNIPSGITLPAGGYLVIAKNAARLRTNYAGLSTANTLGDYSGTLGNGGQRIELNKPDEVIKTNDFGQLVTNKIHVAVDEVIYGPGGRWGQWSGGGGSSLELRDVRGDRRLAPNWADSDETAKSPWVNVEATDTLNNGWAEAYQLHITLQGAGECLIDNVEVIPSGGVNLIANSTFESGTSGWVFQGNHNQTSWEPGEGYGSSHSLHVRATGRGDTGSNRIRTQLASTPAQNTVVTLRAKVRWLKGDPNILLRLRGNWMEAPGYTLVAKNLGTPGAPNSRALANAGPAITSVRHDPPLPAANQPVLVLARVNDPDGIAFLAVNYRIDPSTTYTTLAMTNNGAGLYSAVIPAQVGGVGGAFYIQAMDNFAPPASSTFPDDAPNRECIVRWGDNSNLGTLGSYRFWISQTNVSRWTAEEKKSNNPKDITFIYGTNRIIYNAGGMFHGSPYHAPGYDSPVGNGCDYDLVFPPDDLLLGQSGMSLLRPGNGGGDGTAQEEIHAFWFASQFGIPFNYDRPVFLLVNGLRRDVVLLDSQSPDGDWLNEWYPDDANGELHKVTLGFEYGDMGYSASEVGYAVVGADLNRYVTTGGVKKRARYRQTWPLHSAAPLQENNYTNIFNLVETVLTNATIGSDAYTVALTSSVDVEEWFKVHVAQHLYNNTDSFSYGGGQNAYGYKPQRDTWKLLLWDVDFAFGGTASDANLFGIGGAEHGPRNDHAPFRRIYFQALIQAANGFMTPARSNPILDARYNGMVAAGAGVGSPSGIESFIATKRSVVLSQIAASQSPFKITSNGGADFSTNRNLINISGTAPLEVRTILVNGVAYSLSWTSLSNWVVRLPLVSGTNTLLITGVDPKGVLVAGVSGTIRINYTGVNELPQDKIVINEIMYNPIVPGASYVEIYNSSVTNAFDMSGWRLDGVGFTFLPGTIIEPGAYLVLAKDRFVFGQTYGLGIPVAGEFPGGLSNGGETLTLVKPGATPDQDVIIDQVTYDNDLPWPTGADGRGSALQLIDPTQDNNRSANWSDLLGWRFVSTNINIGNAFAGSTNLYILLDSAGDVYIDDLALVALTGPTTGTNLIQNGGFEEPLAGWGFGTNLTNTTISSAFFHFGSNSLHLVSTGFGTPTTNGSFWQTLPVNTNTVYNLSYWFLPTTNANKLTVRFNTFARPEIIVKPPILFTPGAANNVRASLPPFPPLWLNEVLPNNFFLSTNGITDNLGERDPWVELYNSGTNDLPLAGYFLANNYGNLAQWAFPSNAVIGAQQFLIVWLDGQSEQSTDTELHANFRIAPSVGSVVLSRGSDLASVLDFLNYRVQVAGRSYGSYPDGNVSGRRVFSIVTPGATNNPTSAPVSVFINEWMADNLSTVANPANGHFEDWLELYNPDTNAVDLTGFFLSDTLTNTTQSPIPDGTIIPAGGYLLVWADNSLNRNSPTNIDIHAGFALSKAGEAIGLFAPDGTVIDAVPFGPQFTDISQGRFPDGAASIYFMTNTTPRAANYLYTANTPPVLGFISDKSVNAGFLLTFTASASDTDVPAQTLAFSLDAGAPSGASIDPSTGLFTWTPDEAQAPASYPISVRVTDNGVPNLSAAQTFTVNVLPPFRAGITRAGSQITLSFQTIPGHTYRIEWKATLADPMWQPLGADIPATDPNIERMDEIDSNEQRFYRLVLVN